MNSKITAWPNQLNEDIASNVSPTTFCTVYKKNAPRAARIFVTTEYSDLSTTGVSATDAAARLKNDVETGSARHLVKHTKIIAHPQPGRASTSPDPTWRKP